MFTVTTGKVFEGSVAFMGMNLSYKLVFTRVENNTFDSENGLYSEGFGELFENSLTSNGRISQTAENFMQLNWDDGSSDFEAVFIAEDGTFNGSFTQRSGSASGQKGTFALRAAN